MTGRSLSARKDAAVCRAIGLVTDIYAKRAKNSEIWDQNERRFIDFAAGIAVLNTGHGHPRIQEAVKAQLECFWHTCFGVVPYEGYIELAERLNDLVPGDFSKKTIFLTTGAEANENAVKIARAATGRSAVIAFAGGFHGRTFMGLALTGKVAPYKINFGTLPGEVYHVPFPNPLYGVSVDETLASIRCLFTVDVDPKMVAAFIIEPVQGEGGFHAAPASLLKALREICDEHGILLIADEIQTGFARTGRMFAMEHFGVAADITTMAKSIAGGFPLSAVTGRAEVMDAPGPGGLGGTFAGNPLSIAAALSVLKVIEDERLCDRANQLGTRLKQRLQSLRKQVPQIADVRGPGFMNAIEFKNAATGQPDSEFTERVRRLAIVEGLILLTCGANGNVIRFLAPITIEDAVFAEGVDMLERAIVTASIENATE